MDAIEMLISDHQRVRKLFEAFENGDHRSAPSYGSTGRETATDRPEVAQLCAELEAHALVEERVFYPAVRALNDDALNRQVSGAIEEHATVKDAVASLRAMNGAFTDIAARIKRLGRDVDRHVTAEEDEMLPRVAELMPASRREALARQMEELKESGSELVSEATQPAAG
jgi:hemerythrin superfamily protein